ncbi:hypothetical protein GCM10011586_22770 [Silvibacterium dinghuense]|nr:hypothetical protein GCM10011586_22770 [Silvibacterium dinghuense]
MPPSDPQAFLFPIPRGSFIDTGNYRNRVLRKLAERLGFPKLTFQVIRRTIATLAKDKGHIKDIQEMMRHSRVATTTDVYMQSLHEGVRSTVNSIYNELMDTGTLGKDGAGRRMDDAARESRAANPPRVRGVVLEFATKSRKGGAAKCLK